MNVQDCTVAEVKSMALLYQIFERLLFNYVGNERGENIFCVPWYTSGMTPLFVNKLTNNFDGVARNWQKYSALNLLPMRDKGTIEFRHLHGTCDVQYIMRWIRLITSMRSYAKKMTYKALTNTLLAMNTVSNYDQFIADVFGADTPYLTVGDFKSAMSVGVIDAKLMVMKPVKPKTTNWAMYGAADLDLDGLLREMRAARPAQEAVMRDLPTAEGLAADVMRARAVNINNPLVFADEMFDDINRDEGDQF
jgi:hypothetical protein